MGHGVQGGKVMTGALLLFCKAEQELTLGAKGGDVVQTWCLLCLILQGGAVKTHACQARRESHVRR